MSEEYEHLYGLEEWLEDELDDCERMISDYQSPEDNNFLIYENGFRQALRKVKSRVRELANESYGRARKERHRYAGTRESSELVSDSGLVKLREWLTDRLLYFYEDEPRSSDKQDIEFYNETRWYCLAMMDTLGKLNEFIKQEQLEKHQYVPSNVPGVYMRMSKCKCGWMGGWCTTDEAAEALWERHMKEMLG